jgi:hypothetical protein
MTSVYTPHINTSSTSHSEHLTGVGSACNVDVMTAAVASAFSIGLMFDRVTVCDVHQVNIECDDAHVRQPP